MAEWEDPGLPSFHRHTTITTTHTATISENDLKTIRKDFPQLKIKRGSHIEMVRKGADAACLGPAPPTLETRGRKDITFVVVLPEKQRLQTLHESPEPWGLALGRQAPTMLDFENKQAYVQERQRAIGNQNLLLKVHAKLTCSEAQHRKKAPESY